MILDYFLILLNSDLHRKEVSMSTYYKIGEIAALYGISTDVLRYYEELGILVPRRATNGYRVYRTEDLWCLNIIRDLRGLGFSMDQIRDYIMNRSVRSTLELFEQEMDLIDRQIDRLNALRDNITARRQTIARASELPRGEITLKEMPARPCHRIMQSYKTNEEMDILIKQLVSIGPGRQYIIGNNQMGSFVNPEAAMEGRCQQYDAVFILHPDGEHQIEPGAYLSVCYNGDCRQNQIYVPQLIQHARDHSMTILGPMLELLWIDVHATMYEQEQVTELQLKVGETSPT